jgi:DNA end-binding protein Ku
MPVLLHPGAQGEFAQTTFKVLAAGIHIAQVARFCPSADVELKMLKISHNGKGAKNGASNTALVAQRGYRDVSGMQSVVRISHGDPLLRLRRTNVPNLRAGHHHSPIFLPRLSREPKLRKQFGKRGFQVMAARAIWKGELKIGSTKIPVKLYSAVVDRTVHFNILDDKHLMRVKQRMVSPDSGEEVATEEIQKGYEIEPGRFVIVTDEELKSLEPKPSRDIEIIEFVPPEAVSPQWYERPYYLAPDGDEKAYFALVEALKNRKREGIAHWVMRNKAYVGALRAEGDYLVLVTLRNAEEVISARDLPKPAGRAPTQKELNMAKQLVGLLEDEFNPADYKDEYRERVMKFIEQKAKGKKPRLHAVKARRKAGSLDSVLEKSLQSLRKEKRAA